MKYTWSTLCGTALCLTAMWVSAAVARGAEKEIKVKPGEFVIDHPTLINLGFEWVIQGDDNRNAKVEVSYRKQGEAQWSRVCLFCGCRANGSIRTRAYLTWSLPTCLQAAFWIWNRIRPMKPDLSCRIRTVSSGKAVRRDEDREVRTRPEPKPSAGGQGLSRLSHRTIRAPRSSRLSTRSCALITITAAAAIP